MTDTETEPITPEPTGWTTVGVDYCTRHHGIRNEDEHLCDIASGYVRSEWWPDDQVDDDGEPLPCELVPLYRRAADDDRGVHLVHVFVDTAGEYRWRAVAGNGRIVADSAESYVRKSYALEMANRLFPGVEVRD